MGNGSFQISQPIPSNNSHLPKGVATKLTGVMDTNHLESQIDQLYDLSEEEIKIVEGV
jgi:hypothetical protein